MVFLAETSASNVSSVAFNGYFTADYDVYKIFIDGWYGTTPSYSRLTFNTTGSYTEQTSNYFYHLGSYYEYGGNTTSISYDHNFGGANAINWGVHGNVQASSLVAEITLYNPLSTTYQKLISVEQVSYYSSYLGFGSSVGGWQVGGTATTGITLKANTGNIYARKIRLYGIKNS